MTNILSRQQWKLIQRGFTPEKARILAYKQQKEKGNLIAGTFRLSETGQQYSELSSAQRAIVRRAQKEGRPFSQYIYANGKVKRKGLNNF